jgi:hypothetical protein
MERNSSIADGEDDDDDDTDLVSLPGGAETRFFNAHSGHKSNEQGSHL